MNNGCNITFIQRSTFCPCWLATISSEAGVALLENTPVRTKDISVFSLRIYIFVCPATPRFLHLTMFDDLMKSLTFSITISNCWWQPVLAQSLATKGPIENASNWIDPVEPASCWMICFTCHSQQLKARAEISQQSWGKSRKLEKRGEISFII